MCDLTNNGIGGGGLLHLYAVDDYRYMKRTLVLAVDRDDDFGVKGKVVTPVIGLDQCLEAANALGIADPEDSDLNALYAAISTCMELREDEIDADVALICGDERVGHRSDLALVAQLETVLDEYKPDNVILIGDGAEDEYIYPIISSRTHVDSVKKVYVKQAPNIESSFYVITKMLSEPNKRKRFLAPIGAMIFAIAFVMLVPDLVLLIMSGDLSSLPAITGDAVLLVIGLVILGYAYSFQNKWERYMEYIRNNILARGIMMVMSFLAVGIVLIGAIVSYYQIMDTFYPDFIVMIVSFCSLMVWPVMLAIMAFLFGKMMDDIQVDSVLRLTNLFDCFSIASLGITLTGIIDIVLYYIYPGYEGLIGIVEIFLGLAIAIVSNFIKRQYSVPAVAG